MLPTLDSPPPAVDLEIVIPAFNEAARLVTALQKTILFLEAQSWRARLIVVDNGSADDTAGVARTVRSDYVQVAVIGCARPGKGAAVRRGLSASRAPFVGFFDPDLSTPVATLARTMHELRAGATAVIASRYAPGARVVQPQSLGRRLGGFVFRVLARPLIPSIYDSQCGFKFFRRDAVQRAVRRCRVDGFAFDVELLRYISAVGGRIVEIPVPWSDDRRSTFRPLRDGIGSLADVLQLYRTVVL